MQQVRLLAEEVRKDHQSIDVLVNNAGVYMEDKQLSKVSMLGGNLYLSTCCSVISLMPWLASMGWLFQRSVMHRQLPTILTLSLSLSLSLSPCPSLSPSPSLSLSLSLHTRDESPNVTRAGYTLGRVRDDIRRQCSGPVPPDFADPRSGDFPHRQHRFAVCEQQCGSGESQPRERLQVSIRPKTSGLHTCHHSIGRRVTSAPWQSVCYGVMPEARICVSAAQQHAALTLVFSPLFPCMRLKLSQCVLFEQASQHRLYL